MRLEAKRTQIIATDVSREISSNNIADVNDLLQEFIYKTNLLSENECDKKIGGDDQCRLNMFNTHTWSKELIEDISGFYFHKYFIDGNSDPAIVSKFSDKDAIPIEKKGKIESIKNSGIISDFMSKLPLIVYRKGEKYIIDDGNHRAVALISSGITKAWAYVGEPF